MRTIIDLSCLSRRLAARGLTATVILARMDGEPVSDDDARGALDDARDVDVAHAIGDTLQRVSEGIERPWDYRDAVLAALRAGDDE